MRLTLLLCAAFAATPAFAAEPPTIEKLIEQLGSRSFPERERATKALRERGPIGLPALRKALETKDEEVRKRIEGLIPGLEIEEALLPKRVTLPAGSRTVLLCLQEFGKQTGFKLLEDSRNGDAKFSAELRDVPFWDAIEQLNKEAKTGLRWDEYQKTLHFFPSQTRSPHVNVRGPFRLEATWFHEDRDVDFTQTKPDAEGWRNHRLTLAVSLLAEPRITFVKIDPAKVDKAIDSDGKSLLEPADALRESNLARSARGRFRGEFNNSTDIRLQRASESAKTIKLVRGTIPIKAIVIRRPTVITSKLGEASGVSFRAGTDSLQITRVNNQGGGSIEVQILVPYNNGNSDSWHQRFHVEDDDGNRFQDHGRGSSSDGRQQWISLYYGPPFNAKKKVGPPTKLIFEDWVVHDYAIPFEFKDVKLP